MFQSNFQTFLAILVILSLFLGLFFLFRGLIKKKWNIVLFSIVITLAALLIINTLAIPFLENLYNKKAIPADTDTTQFLSNYDSSSEIIYNHETYRACPQIHEGNSNLSLFEVYIHKNNNSVQPFQKIVVDSSNSNNILLFCTLSEQLVNRYSFTGLNNLFEPLFETTAAPEYKMVNEAVFSLFVSPDLTLSELNYILIKPVSNEK